MPIITREGLRVISKCFLLFNCIFANILWIHGRLSIILLRFSYQMPHMVVINIKKQKSSLSTYDFPPQAAILKSELTKSATALERWQKLLVSVTSVLPNQVKPIHVRVVVGRKSGQFGSARSRPRQMVTSGLHETSFAML